MEELMYIKTKAKIISYFTPRHRRISQMIDEIELRKTIVRFKKVKIPYVYINAIEEELAIELQALILKICSELSLQILIERKAEKLTIRNLYFSIN